MRIQIGCVLLLMLCALPLAGQEQPRVTIEELRKHWDAHREKFAAVKQQTWTLEYHSEGKLEGRLFYSTQRDGDTVGRLRLQRNMQPARVFLFNHDHAAELKETADPDRPLKVMAFTDFVNPLNKRESCDTVQMAVEPWQRPVGLVGFACGVGMLDPRWCEIVSIEPEDKTLVKVKYARDSARLPDGSKPDETLTVDEHISRDLLLMHSAGTFWFDARYGYALTRYEGTRANGTKRTEILTDYRMIKGACWYPFTVSSEWNNPDSTHIVWRRCDSVSTEATRAADFAVPAELVP